MSARAEFALALVYIHADWLRAPVDVVRPDVTAPECLSQGAHYQNRTAQAGLRARNATWARRRSRASNSAVARYWFWSVKIASPSRFRSASALAERAAQWRRAIPAKSPVTSARRSNSNPAIPSTRSL